ncbi:DUF2147 domain-containing protein [Caulobacter sp. KR2-114]|uniref:DUF2147 domain-containing protein n=1 Tax=Caulobacter sp. KR2-114 TaxID=3400912 RepID=UPI003C059342
MTSRDKRAPVAARTLLLAAAFSLGAASQALARGPEGRWVTASGNVVVAIAPCGPALCGTIDRVLANHSMAHPGQTMAALPGLGVKVLTGLAADGPGRWTGRIYNREDGKTYDCQVSLGGADSLVVRPYVGLPVFGRTQIWRRAAQGQ